MKLKHYLWDNKLLILLYLIVTFIIFVFLWSFHMNYVLIFYVIVLLLLNGFILILASYFKKRFFYQQLLKNVKELDQKYFALELISNPNFLEGKIVYQCLYDINKSMIEHLNQYKFQQEEFREYVEMWIHEVKTPIASSKLVIENNPSKTTKSIDEEMDKIEGLLEQILYYVRSDNVEKDYLIKSVNLDSIIKNCIRKNKKNFIEKNISLDFQTNDYMIPTDSKWLEFIISQILQNSIKYLNKETNHIIITSESNHDNVILRIEDNGIGIPKYELSKVFDKGYTGSNGRLKYNSTGMGLYLCKKLCQKLGHEIIIQSIEQEKTVVTIIFPKNSFTLSKN